MLTVMFQDQFITQHEANETKKRMYMILTISSVTYVAAIKAEKFQAWGLFLKSPETFRAYFGCHNCLYIFATPRF